MKLNSRTRSFFKIALSAFVVLTASTGRSEWNLGEYYCQLQEDPPRSFPPGESGLHYAPSREIDVLHLALDVTPDFKEHSVAGTAKLRFKPIAQPLAELRLDGVDLDVSDVVSTAEIENWHASPQGIRVIFAKPIPIGQETSVTVTYSARPKQGMYFRTPDMGYAAGDMHLWTQGEPIEARYWFPSYDFPNEKFTTEILCHVPEGMEVISNGRKTSETMDSSTGLKAVRWLQDKPHANYLVSLLAGYFKKIEDEYRGIPIAFWTPASEIEYAKNSFEGTKDMLGYFEKEIGVPYPWDKYDQVCVLDFHWGGMENTSVTTLNDRTLHTADTEELQDSQGLVAHELAHQWFGDLLTCKDWGHIWLNEGFATYYEALYDGHKHGRDTLLYRMHQSAQGITGQGNDTNAMVRRDYKSPVDQFGFLAYPKGSWILHMLRSRLGEDLYRQCIRTYVERNRYLSVQTQNLIDVIEELSGRSFDQFFDQYVFHAHHPELKLDYSWDPKTKLAKLAVQQTQKLSDKVLLFNVPLTVRFKSKAGTADREIQVRNQAEDFYLPLPEAPQIVRIDPECALLAKIDFKPSSAMLNAQLADKDDMMGRLLAVEQLGAKKEKDSVAKLKGVLNGDPFWGVRLEASEALRGLGTDEAFQALTDSLRQKDARVRQRVLRDLASFYRETAYDVLKGQLSKEKNPDLQAAILVALGAYAKPEVHETLLKYLKTKSYRNGLAEAAINGMKAQDDSRFIEPLLEHLRSHEANFDMRDFGAALNALAFLAREQDNKEQVREFLLSHTDSPKDRVARSAIQALGVLGDAKAMAALETFASAPKDSPERQAAEKSIASLRDTQKAAADLSKVRKEVMDLQKDNRTLRQDLEELKKKLEALTQEPVDAKASKKKKAR